MQSLQAGFYAYTRLARMSQYLNRSQFWWTSLTSDSVKRAILILPREKAEVLTNPCDEIQT